MAQVNATLKQRGKRYGDFTDFAKVEQELKTVMRDCPNWQNLSDAHKSALEMCQHKITRILTGDPNYADSWHDIQGYAKLGEDRCEQ